MAGNINREEFWYLSGLTSAQNRVRLPPLLSVSGLTAVDPLAVEDYGLPGGTEVEYRPYTLADSDVRRNSEHGVHALAQDLLRKPGLFKEVLNLFNTVRLAYFDGQPPETAELLQVAQMLETIQALPIFLSERGTDPIPSGEIPDVVAVAALGASGIAHGISGMKSGGAGNNVSVTVSSGILDVDALIESANRTPSSLITMIGIGDSLATATKYGPPVDVTPVDRSVCPASNQSIRRVVETLVFGLNENQVIAGYEIPEFDIQNLATVKKLGRLTPLHYELHMDYPTTSSTPDSALHTLLENVRLFQRSMAELLGRKTTKALYVEDLFSDPSQAQLATKLSRAATATVQPRTPHRKPKPRPTGRTGGGSSGGPGSKNRRRGGRRR